MVGDADDSVHVTGDVVKSWSELFGLEKYDKLLERLNTLGAGLTYMLRLVWCLSVFLLDRNGVLNECMNSCICRTSEARTVLSCINAGAR